MAVYARDKPGLFEQAVRSVLSNSLAPEEFLIVADGPLTAHLEGVIADARSRSSNVRVLRCPVNKGLAAALNTGIEAVRTSWIVRADSDDINLQDRFLKLAILVADHPEVRLVGSAILEVEEHGQAVAVRRVPSSTTEIRRFAKKRNPFNHMSVAFERSVVLHAGGYPDVFLKEDYALWCRLLADGIEARNSDEILVHAAAGRGMYRRRGGLRYAASEIAIQQTLVRCGLKSQPEAWLDGILRATVFLLPNFVRAFVYETLLRNKP